jgi:curved DNA-binding protein CbpA
MPDPPHMDNPYEILGIAREASTGQIKKAYFNLVKQYSPETHGEQFKRIRHAYERLRDQEKRRETDVFLFDDPHGSFKAPEASPSFRLRVDVHKIMNILLREGSDLDRQDFSDDFTDIEADGNITDT